MYLNFKFFLKFLQKMLFHFQKNFQYLFEIFLKDYCNKDLFLLDFPLLLIKKEFYLSFFVFYQFPQTFHLKLA